MIARILHLRRLGVSWDILLGLDRVANWFLRVWYCHHNARVIRDFEYRMAVVLTTCTRGMSKPYYTIEAMQAEIHDFIMQSNDEAVDDWCKDHGLDRAKIEASE